MNEFQSSGVFGRTRAPFAPTPNYGDENDLTQVDAAVENIAQPQGVQEAAALSQDDAGAAVGHDNSDATPLPEPVQDFKVSVEDIRLRLHERGIEKSKDTIQRYCREGALACVKLGLMRRYFATEESVEALIEKLQQDVPASNGTPVHAAADDELGDEMQAHAAVNEADVAGDTKPHPAASTSMQVQAGEHSSMQVDDPVVDLLNQQIESLKDQVGFLREELVDRRQQAKALQDVIAGMKDQSKANLLNAETQTKANVSNSDRRSYTATVVEEEDDDRSGQGDNRLSHSIGDDV